MAFNQMLFAYLPLGSANDNGDNLASEFAAHLNQLSLKAPLQHRRPSPLDPPTAAVAAQLDALQINDWPEPDAGVQTALAFAKPYECEQLLTAAPQHAEGPLGVGISVLPLPEDNNASKESLVRSWSAQEEWLTPQQFVAQLHSAPYHVLLGCDSWRACSSMVFPATRVGQRAVQAVEVLAKPHLPGINGSSSCSNGNGGSSSQHGEQAGADSEFGELQRYTFTFCLEHIQSGPYKGCWMTVGVRPGNYSV
eukprot:GHRR01022911.1.p1 GENE.GHRR01022911.1~~GHRR01022911.1.p1  ORF type:complete len:251 (+),score=99.09 GHRR01022911.1:309-1061(+)